MGTARTRSPLFAALWLQRRWTSGVGLHRRLVTKTTWKEHCLAFPERGLTFPNRVLLNLSEGKRTAGWTPADCHSDKGLPENRSEMLGTPQKDLKQDRKQTAPLKHNKNQGSVPRTFTFTLWAGHEITFLGRNHHKATAEKPRA